MNKIFMSRIQIHKGNIFYLDTIGALLSICLLGIILPMNQSLHGMPRHILYGLCGWAFLCLIYDCCYLYWGKQNQPQWLFGIMTLNCMYCCITLILILLHFGDLSLFGKVYFISEIPIILSLVMLERNIFLKVTHDIPQNLK